MVHVDKDGYAVASAQFGQHSLDKNKLAPMVEYVRGYVMYQRDVELHSPSGTQIKNLIRTYYPGLSVAEQEYIYDGAK